MRETDEDLVQKVKEGDLRAFDELYARYLNPIYRYIYKKTFHHQDTEDICQEVFIRVFRYIRHFKSDVCDNIKGDHLAGFVILEKGTT